MRNNKLKVIRLSSTPARGSCQPACFPANVPCRQNRRSFAHQPGPSPTRPTRAKALRHIDPFPRHSVSTAPATPNQTDAFGLTISREEISMTTRLQEPASQANSRARLVETLGRIVARAWLRRHQSAPSRQQPKADYPLSPPKLIDPSGPRQRSP
jgi:hypothetical protein